jgi:adenylate cyclase
MGIEIERKFLVDTNLLPTLTAGVHIKQGYIQTADKTVVRVRIKDQEAYLTIKGENQGIKRLEFEYPIPIENAHQMIDNLCSKNVIDKIRYEVRIENHVWEIDIFHGENDGLIIAEVELNDENEDLFIPDWILKEVSHDAKYYNSNLIANPFLKW